jgi:DNA repair photolyase
LLIRGRLKTPPLQIPSLSTLNILLRFKMKIGLPNKVTTGTREWSDVSHNIGQNCSHNCRYCYAAAYALAKGHIKTREEWSTEILTPRRIPTKPGTIMFPTAHDITPFYLDASLTTIEQMMLAGRNVVIVTKAHLECMKAICDKFTGYKKQLLIRVTIGSMKEAVCKFWEPGAPSPSERLV